MASIIWVGDVVLGPTSEDAEETEEELGGGL